MNINTPIKLPKTDDVKNISDVADRNFTTLWNSQVNMDNRIKKLESASNISIVSATNDTLTIKANGRNYTLKVEV